MSKIVNENLRKKISSFPEAIQKERDAEAARLASQDTKRTVQAVSRTTTSSQRPAAPKKEVTQEPSSKPSQEKKDPERAASSR